MSEDKSTKTNGPGSDPMQRLPSVKPPRDLTLGGIKTNKKIFTPNLNVARNKNKGPAKPNLNQRKEDRDKRDRRNDRNKNSRNGPNIIKSSGVFSEGLGSAERHSSRASYGSRETESVQNMQKPTIRVKDVVKIDRELEEQKIRSVLGDSHLADDESNEDFKHLHERDAPIKLPMDDGVIEEDKKPVTEVKKEVFEDTDVVKLLMNNEPTLLLLQLPDSLPGRGGKVEDEAPRRKITDEPSTSNDDAKKEENEQKEVDNRCRLSDLEEGRIGKLLVHRSGKVTLSLGDTMFEVCLGTKASFHQELMSVGADVTSRSARAVALGALPHKLNLVPRWETLLH